MLKRSSVLRGYPCQLRQANQQFLAEERKRMKPLSEKKPINKLLRNDFVSKVISAVNRAYIQAKLSISTLTRPTENSQPTSSRSKTLKNHYRKTCTYTIIEKHTQKLINQKEIVPQQIPAVNKAVSSGEAQYCETNPAKRKQPTNNLLLEDFKEPLLKNIRNNQLIQNQFASQFITVFNWARVKAKLTIASLTWPNETSQPTISRAKTRKNETIIGTQAKKPVTSKRICLTTDLSCQKSKSQSEAQYFKTNPAKRKQPTNNFLLEDPKEPLLKNIRNNQVIQNEFVSQSITGFTWARVWTKLTIASLTWPTETSQQTISRSKTRTTETIIGTQANKPVTSKLLSQNGLQLSIKHV